jgi:hypothetical protein
MPGAKSLVGSSSGTLTVVPSSAPAWSEALCDIPRHDFYHLPSYHRLAEAHGEGEALAVIYRESPYTLLLPLVLRPVAEVPGLEGASARDVTSVHGYAGPVVSHEDLPAEVHARFAAALRETLLDLSVVSAFSRLHPFLGQEPLLGGLGEVIDLGSTVSLDLRLSDEEQWAQYRHNHRRDILRLQRMGTTVVHDHDWSQNDAFAAMHDETLARVHAGATYRLDRSDLLLMRRELADTLHLLVCQRGDEMLCGGLFSVHGRFAQYHLGATPARFLRLAPMKLLIHQVRDWARQRGAGVLHLGGGVGAREDGLYHFKRGFSSRTHRFRVWHWVLDERRYRNLCARVRRPAEGKSGFFPAYRQLHPCHASEARREGWDEAPASTQR